MKTAAVFVHHPMCSVQSCNGILRSLSGHFKFKIFTRHPTENNFFDDVDLIIVPGGLGDSNNFKSLLKNHVIDIQKFIKRGGKYLGICMGAYWADKHYLNILDQIRVVQYIKRPNSDTKRPHAKAQKVLWNGKEENMFFYDGCALIGPGLDQSIIYSLYPNGDAMAVISKNIGLIGCHPESEAHWYESYSWLNGLYHNGEHHQYLVKFVDKLMKFK